MPVRIYEIAKKLGVTSKQVLEKAKQLGVKGAKAPSSSIDKITAEYVGEELAKDLGIKPDQIQTQKPETHPKDTATNTDIEIVEPQTVSSEKEVTKEKPGSTEIPTAESLPEQSPETITVQDTATPTETKTHEPVQQPLIQNLTTEPVLSEEISTIPQKTEEPSTVTIPTSNEQSTPPQANQIETITITEEQPAPADQQPNLNVITKETVTQTFESEIPQPATSAPEPTQSTSAQSTTLIESEYKSVIEKNQLETEPSQTSPTIEVPDTISVQNTAQAQTPQTTAATAPTQIPPAEPPKPQIGDKVGFIQLPPKPKPGDKVGSIKLPPRPQPKQQQSQKQKQEKQKPQKTQQQQQQKSQPQQVKQQPQQKQQHSKAQPQPKAAVPSRSPKQQPAQPPSTQTKQIPTVTQKPQPSATQPATQKKDTPLKPQIIVPPENAELISMKPPIIVRQLAEKMRRKPFQLIADLIELGVFANVNQAIEESVAQRLCAKHGFRFELEKRERGAGLVHGPPIKKVELDKDDKPEDMKPRPPVVTIMGHVDHGKTTLLDAIRKSNVAANEAGGITQHIGAYTIMIPHPDRPQEMQQITFLDTPGHEAFSAMRARGANVTDIVILVVSAIDGVQPQTVEAIRHAQAAKVTIMVAINKCDHPQADPMKVRKQLQEYGLLCEEWGGNTVFVEVSALTRKGIDKLLELLVLQAEVLELKANPNRKAKGNVIESGITPGGPTATLLVRKGTLKRGDVVLCGQYFGRARALMNEEGQQLKEAGPSIAVRMLGLNGVPEAGEEFVVVDNEKIARELAEKKAEELKQIASDKKPRVTLENLFETIKAESLKVLKVVVKADTQGSVEAIVDALKKIESKKVSLEIIHYAVGTVTESDVLLASASNAIILGFHTRVDHSAAETAKREGVQIKLYSIIYELIEEVKLAMAGLLEPVIKEVSLGTAEVRKIFTLSKGGNVAGCMVTNGRITKGKVRVLRNNAVIYEGNIQSLRRFQDEVSEVRAGMECGIRIDGFSSFNEGDIIESYTVEKIVQSL